MPNSFLAAHLRIENPFAEQAGVWKRHGHVTYAHYSAQAKAYLATVRTSNISFVLHSARHRLRGPPSHPRTLPPRVYKYRTKKIYLLKSADLEELESLKLRSDERTSVGFLVVQKAEHFLGVGDIAGM